MKNIFLLVLFSYAITSKLLSFEPAVYAPASNNFYLEIAPANVAIPQVRSFVTRIIGPQLWETLAAQSAIQLGFNLFNSAELAAVGIDPNSAMGISGSILTTSPPVSIYIPASNPAKLYSLFKETAERNASSSDMFGEDVEYDDEGNIIEKPQTPQESPVRELKEGQLLEIAGSTPTYVALGKNFLLITTDKNTIDSGMNPAANSIASQPYYQKLKANFTRNNGGKLPVVALYMNPSVLSTIEKMSSQIYGEQLSEELVGDMQKNVIGMGGYWGFEAQRTILSFTYLYRKGYLTNPNSEMARMMQLPAGALTLEFFKTMPVFFLSFRFNLPAVLDFIIAKDNELKENLERVKLEAKQQLKIDLEQDLLRAFKGNFAALVTAIPPEKTIQQYRAWDWYANAGIFKGKAVGINKFLNNFAEFNRRQGKSDISITSHKVGANTLWTIGVKSGIGNRPQTVKDPDNIFIFVTDEEILVGGKNNVSKPIPQATRSIAEQVTGSSNNKNQALLYVNLEAIVNYISKSSMKGMAGMYLPYVRPLSSVYLTSGTEGDAATSEFVIRLK